MLIWYWSFPPFTANSSSVNYSSLPFVAAGGFDFWFPDYIQLVVRLLLTHVHGIVIQLDQLIKYDRNHSDEWLTLELLPVWYDQRSLGHYHWRWHHQDSNLGPSYCCLACLGSAVLGYPLYQLTCHKTMSPMHANIDSKTDTATLELTLDGNIIYSNISCWRLSLKYHVL